MPEANISGKKFHHSGSTAVSKSLTQGNVKTNAEGKTSITLSFQGFYIQKSEKLKKERMAKDNNYVHV